MQRPNGTKCIYFLLLALALAGADPRTEQPLKNSKWPTNDGYRIAEQWVLQANKGPTLFRHVEDAQQVNKRMVNASQAESGRQLPQHASDEDTGRLLRRVDDTEKPPLSVPSQKTAAGRPQLPREDTEEFPMNHQVTDKAQHISGNLAPDVKDMNGRRLPYQDAEATPELASARERLGFGAVAWLVQRWNQRAAETEELLHESDRLVVTPAPRPMQGDPVALKIRPDNQHVDELRQLNEGEAFTGDEQLFRLKPERLRRQLNEDEALTSDEQLFRLKPETLHRQLNEGEALTSDEQLFRLKPGRLHRQLKEGEALTSDEQLFRLKPERLRPAVQRTAFSKSIASAMGRRAAAVASLRGAVPSTDALYDWPSSIGSVQAILPPARMFYSERAPASPLVVAPTANWGA